MNPEMVVFIGLALVAVASALGMLFSRNAVYSALFLILNFATVAAFYLILHAPFIALSQVTVYAGAIMVLFLFVIMLLGADQAAIYQRPIWSQPLVLFLGALLLVEVAYLVLTQQGTLPPFAAVADSFGDPAQIGELLFNQYLLPFEATSILLLTAMVGAIVLTIREQKAEVRKRAREAAQEYPGVQDAAAVVDPASIAPEKAAAIDRSPSGG